MDELEFLCKCGHSFRLHQQSTFDLWYCDGDEETCECNYFERKRASGRDGDEIEVQYDSDSYRWN